MFMRLVQVKVKPDSVNDLRTAYEQQIIPKLEQVEGCRFASLVQSAYQPEECISLTFWESAEAAEKYVHDGTYDRLLKDVQPYLDGTTEWKVHLSESKTLEYIPVSEEPTVKAYSVNTMLQTGSLSENLGYLYLRILSLRVQPDKMEDLKRAYKEKILPVLHNTAGCLYAYLTENADEKDEAISLTVWDSKEHAEEYERSGAFSSLVGQVKHLLSGLYQWKISLERGAGRNTMTSDDLMVKGYHVVAGKSFI